MGGGIADYVVYALAIGLCLGFMLGIGVGISISGQTR